MFLLTYYLIYQEKPTTFIEIFPADVPVNAIWKTITCIIYCYYAYYIIHDSTQLFPLMEETADYKKAEREAAEAAQQSEEKKED